MGWLEDYIAGKRGMPKADEKKQPEQNKLPEEEQQEYVDRGGVLPIAGSYDSYARQGRNGNREPVNPAGNAAGTTVASANAGEGTVLAPKDEAFKSPYEKAVESVKKDETVADGGKKGAEAGDAESKAGADRYQAILDAAKRYNQMADDEEKKLSEDDRRKVEKAAKRRMLLAGIADAANSFHQAYAYARGIKPMNEGKNYTKDAKKELREDEDWYNKNKDRILNYRLKAAELEKTVEGLRNADRQQARLEADAKTRRLVAEAKAEYQRSLIEKNEANAAYYWAKANALEAGKPYDVAIKEAELARKQAQTEQAKASANASNALADQRRNESQGSTTTTTKVDVTGLPTTTTQVRQYGTGNAGNSNSGKGTGYGTSKGTGYGK